MKFFYLAILGAVFITFAANTLIGGVVGEMIGYGMVFALGLGLMFYVRWFQKLAKKLNALTPLLTEDPDRYIQEMEQFLQGKMPNNVRSMLLMNVAAAFVEKGDYQKAKDKLSAVRGSSLKGANAGIYYLNVCNVLIHLGENETALDYMKRYKKAIFSLPMGGNIPALISFIQVFEAIQTANWDSAKEKMIAVKEAFPEPVTGVDFTVLEKQLEAHFGYAIEAPAIEPIPEEPDTDEEEEN